MPPKRKAATAKQNKGKGKVVDAPPAADLAEGASASAEQLPLDDSETVEQADTQGEGSEQDQDDAQAGQATASVDDRMAKMRALRERMTESARANRQDLISEVNTHRERARNLAKLERKRKLAEAMGEKREAEETGQDLERKRAWEYSIEDNEKWDKKQARKQRRGDFSFTGTHSVYSWRLDGTDCWLFTATDYDDIARRKYKKDMDAFKPDLSSYNKQRSAAEASAAITGGTNSSALVPGSAGDLYRDANSFVYADHKPSEDAIDRVIHKINLDLDKRQKRSRERKEDDGDITYINEKNKQFNKKLARYYDAVTQETRDSFERGTAL
ncbi:Pre-mRNA-splicing factor SYF2 [Microbotryomycetes sp. JL201]|nr:Pre-mRNA-splicing factor SYF2 [Microbotryomycetes sp. JL201]